MPASTVHDLIQRAAGAYLALAEIGEEVDDEWTYVTDLTEAWRARLDEVAAMRGDDPTTSDVDAAIDRAIEEIGRIEDPHRAIDWLSTFPQLVLLALGEPA